MTRASANGARAQAPQTRSQRAFSLVELMLVVAVLAIVASLSLSTLGHDWRRAKLSSTAVEWAAWLELVRKAALRTESGCAITVSTLVDQPTGSAVAVVSNLGAGESSCAAEPTLRFLAPSQGDAISTSATSSTLIFTPRGTILGPAASELASGWELRLSLASTDAMRCIRLSGLLGAVQIGSNATTGSLSAACTDYTAY